MLVVPLLLAAIGRFRFAPALLGGGCLTAAVLVPLAATVLRYRRPHELGLAPDGDPLPTVYPCLSRPPGASLEHHPIVLLSRSDKDARQNKDLEIFSGSLRSEKALAYGFCLGPVTTLSPIVVQREFAAASFGAIYSVAAAVIQLGSAFGPALYGMLRDLSGGYGPVLCAAAAIELVAMLTIIAGKKSPKRADNVREARRR